MTDLEGRLEAHNEDVTEFCPCVCCSLMLGKEDFEAIVDTTIIKRTICKPQLKFGTGAVQMKLDGGGTPHAVGCNIIFGSSRIAGTAFNTNAATSSSAAHAAGLHPPGAATFSQHNPTYGDLFNPFFNNASNLSSGDPLNQEGAVCAACGGAPGDGRTRRPRGGIKKLKELLDIGATTQAEHEKKKAPLLERI
jgi:hypothetical protein